MAMIVTGSLCPILMQCCMDEPHDYSDVEDDEILANNMPSNEPTTALKHSPQFSNDGMQLYE
jgi:hypothetical protein